MNISLQHEAMAKAMFDRVEMDRKQSAAIVGSWSEVGDDVKAHFYGLADEALKALAKSFPFVKDHPAGCTLTQQKVLTKKAFAQMMK